MNYYHNLVTQKSWTELTLLKRRLNFVLIGGWAVYLYTQTLKSKDIDIIVDFTELSRRGRSPKGRKDFLDILSLLTHTIDGTQKLSKIIKMYHLQSLCTVFQEFLHETTQIPELSLNSHQFAKIKQKIALLLAV